MIFKQALQKDFIFYSTAVYAALILVTLTFTLIKLLTQAADGKIDPQSVLVLLGFAIINFQALIVSLSVFIGVLLVYGRMWRDSEMVIWQSSGLSLYQFISPTLEFSVPIALLAAVFGLLIAPWANQQAYQYKDNFFQRQDISRIATQQFKESSDGLRVFYVGLSDERLNQISNIFILEQSAVNRPLIHSLNKKETNKAANTEVNTAVTINKNIKENYNHSLSINPMAGKFNAETIVAANQGRIYTSKEGEQFLELNQGRRYQLPDRTVIHSSMSNNQWTGLIQFEQYTTLLKPTASNAKTGLLPAKQRPSIDLLKNFNHLAQAELLWRTGGALMVIILSVLAVPLSYFNPRTGKSMPLISAVLIFIIYTNMINVCKNYLETEKISPLMAVTLPHGSILLLFFGLLLWRSQSLRRLNAYWRSYLYRLIHTYYKKIFA